MEVAENYRIDANFRWLGSEIKANEELCLTVCGIERCTPDKFFGPSVREDYHVHFILHGKGTLEIGGKSYKLQRGQIFVIPPDVETYYYSDPEDPWPRGIIPGCRLAERGQDIFWKRRVSQRRIR